MDQKKHICSIIFTGLLRVKEQKKWFPKYVFYSLYRNYRKGGTRPFENKTTGLHNIKTDDYVSRYEVTDIDVAEQMLVCNKLDKLQGIIKTREAELEQLELLIKARFLEKKAALNAVLLFVKDNRENKATQIMLEHSHISTRDILTNFC